MKDELKGRLDKAWKAYVRHELTRDPALGADEIRAEDVAAEIEKLLGKPFSASTLSKIRSGRQQPYADQLAAIAEVLGADYKVLVGLRGTGRDLPAGGKRRAKGKEA